MSHQCNCKTPEPEITWDNHCVITIDPPASITVTLCGQDYQVWPECDGGWWATSGYSIGQPGLRIQPDGTKLEIRYPEDVKAGDVLSGKKRIC